MSTRTTEIWTYPGRDWGGTNDITGYKVEAIDGSIGKVDEATYDVGGSYIVVDTAPWIFGKKVLLPAGTLERIDHAADPRVHVNRTKDQIKDAPEYDESRLDDAYRNEVGTYYDAGGRGWRDRSAR